MTRLILLALSTALALSVSACTTTPEPEVIEEPVVVVVPEVIDTCTPVSALTRKVIPAKTKVFYATTEIANPPYEPITRTEKIVREIAPEQIFYVDSDGRQVLDLCDAPVGTRTTALTPEEMEGFDDLGDLQVEQLGGPRTVPETPRVDLDPDN